jgi:hypothetical protein
MSSDRNLDDLFNGDDDEVVIDECITSMANVEPVPLPTTEVSTSEPAAVEDDVPGPTEVVRIVRKKKDVSAVASTAKTKKVSDEKKEESSAPGWRGTLKQSPRCAARCDIVKQEIDGFLASGKLFTSRDLMEVSNGRYNYADVMVVTKALKAGGLISEALKGRAGIWCAPQKPDVAAA